jgi:hypothetical protein
VLVEAKGSVGKPVVKLASVEAATITRGKTTSATSSVDLHDLNSFLKLRFFEKAIDKVEHLGKRLVIETYDAYRLLALDTRTTNISFPVTSVLFVLGGLEAVQHSKHGMLYLLPTEDKDLLEGQRMALAETSKLKPVDKGRGAQQLNNQPLSLKDRQPATILAPSAAVGFKGKVRKAGCKRRCRGKIDGTWVTKD